VKGPIAAIILAAGASRRLGRPKQLLMHEGETLLARTVRLANKAGAAPVFVVLGAYHEQIRAAPGIEGARLVLNDRWEQGISTSIRAGLSALDGADPNAVGALILTCDQPRLAAGHLGTLMESFQERPEPAIAASRYAGIVGIPAVFPRLAFEQLLALRGDKGARAFLAKPPCALIEVPFSGGEIDIDKPEDLAELR
jgi:molybdenum cofactor cytidylyltransferase